MTSLEGKFLIAHPNFPISSTFHKSVIFIYQDIKDKGSIGLILNKPSSYKVQDLCAEKNIIFLDNNTPVFHGGPVNQNALILLHSNEWSSTNTVSVRNDLRITSDGIMLEKLAKGNQPKNWKMFGGMCGWAPQQLQAELQGTYPFKAENSWLIADLDEEFIFNINPKDQYQYAFRKCSSQLFDQYF